MNLAPRIGTDSESEEDDRRKTQIVIDHQEQLSNEVQGLRSPREAWGFVGGLQLYVQRACDIVLQIDSQTIINL